MKKCCWLFGLFDLVCFVGGAYLLSASIFGSCCGAAAAGCCCGSLGLPLIALGFVVHCWKKGGCCSKGSCSDDKSE